METRAMACHSKKGVRIGARIGFLDESAFSDKPMVRRTWAPKGHTPILKVPGRWITRSVISMITCSPHGMRPHLYFEMVRGSINADLFLVFLKQARRHIGGKLILIIDNLKVHKAQKVRAYLAAQKYWLNVEYLPPYAPELNPVEYLWSSRKRKDFGNAQIPDGASLDRRIRASGQKAQRDPNLLRGFLKASTLFS